MSKPSDPSGLNPAERLVCHNCGHIFDRGSVGRCCANPEQHFHNTSEPCGRCRPRIEIAETVGPPKVSILNARPIPGFYKP